LEHCKKDEKSIDRFKRAVKRKLDVDEEIIDDSDHDSENVANILLDLSTSKIPVMRIEKEIGSPVIIFNYFLFIC
jgi:hypothetical protein